jgi:hypothetical protein
MNRNEIMRINSLIYFFPLLIAYGILLIWYPFLSVDLLKYLVFQIFVTLIPGFYFSGKLIKNINLSLFERCIMGYPFVYIIVSIITWVSIMLNLPLLLIYQLIICPLSLYNFVQYIRKSKVSNDIDKNLFISHSLFFGIAFFVMFITFLIAVAPPEVDKLGIYYQDSLWTLGNTWSIIRGIPVIDARLSEAQLGYHFIQSIWHATIHRLTGIHPFNTQFYLDSVFNMFLLISVLTIGLRKMLKYSLLKVNIFMFFLLFTSGYGFLLGGLQGHIFYNPISLFFGLPAFLLLFFAFYDIFENNSEYHPLYLLSLFIFVAMSKAHLLIVFPAVFMIMFGLGIFFKEKFITIKNGVSLFLFLISTAFLYLYIYKPGSDGRVISIFSQNISPNSPAYPIFVFFQNTVMSRPIEILLLFTKKLLYFGIIFLKQPFILISIITLIISKNYRKNLLKIPLILHSFLLLFPLLSFCMASSADFPGGGAYFIWYSKIVFIPYLVMLISFYIKKKNMVSIILIFMLTGFGIVNYSNLIFKWINLDWWTVSVLEHKPRDSRMTIDKYEWEAMEWIRKNTSQRAIIASDRRSFFHETAVPPVELGRFFGYSALSGRQFWVEGDSFLLGSSKKIAEKRWTILNSFFNTSNKEEQKRLGGNIEADYLIQSKRFNKNKIEILDKVFENASVNIFKLRK